MGSKQNGKQTVTKKTAISNVHLLSQPLKDALLARGFVTVHQVRQAARGGHAISVHTLRRLVRSHTRHPSSNARDAEKIEEIFTAFGLREPAASTKKQYRQQDSISAAAE